MQLTKILFTKKKPTITVGGETFSPMPLGLEQVLELLLLLAPYVALIEQNWSDFKRALQNTSGERPRLLSAMFTTLSKQINPVDITKAFAILLGKPPEWFVNVKAVELVEALPILDDINDFQGLFEALQGLGLTMRYTTDA